MKSTPRVTPYSLSVPLRCAFRFRDLDGCSSAAAAFGRFRFRPVEPSASAWSSGAASDSRCVDVTEKCHEMELKRCFNVLTFFCGLFGFCLNVRLGIVLCSLGTTFICSNHVVVHPLVELLDSMVPVHSTISKDTVQEHDHFIPRVQRQLRIQYTGLD